MDGTVRTVEGTARTVDDAARPPAPAPGVELVIFDCDGVLVDSEPIALALLHRTIARSGLDLPLATVQATFQGRSLAGVLRILQERFDHAIAPAAVEGMGAELLASFTQQLQPVEGIGAVVDAVRARRAVASSSGTQRLGHSLAVTGLADRFPPDAVFSADAVRRGKPAPDLFLYAAARVGVPPRRAMVVEDSPAGIRAARSAGMRVVGFAGGSHARVPGYVAGLREAGAPAIAPDADALLALLRVAGAAD